MFIQSCTLTFFGRTPVSDMRSVKASKGVNGRRKACVFISQWLQLLAIIDTELPGDTQAVILSVLNENMSHFYQVHSIYLLLLLLLSSHSVRRYGTLVDDVQPNR